MGDVLSDPNPWILTIIGGVISAVVAGVIVHWLTTRKPDRIRAILAYLFLALYGGYLLFLIFGLIVGYSKVVSLIGKWTAFVLCFAFPFVYGLCFLIASFFKDEK